jgi:hypothetical protein
VQRRTALALTPPLLFATILAHVLFDFSGLIARLYVGAS